MVLCGRVVAVEGFHQFSSDRRRETLSGKGQCLLLGAMCDPYPDPVLITRAFLQKIENALPRFLNLNKEEVKDGLDLNLELKQIFIGWPESSEEFIKKSVARGLESINLQYGIDWIHSSDALEQDSNNGTADAKTETYSTKLVAEETINENAGMTKVPESMVETEMHSTKRSMEYDEAACLEEPKFKNVKYDFMTNSEKISEVADPREIFLKI